MAQECFEENIKYEEEYIVNSRGLKLFTCRWIPTNQDPKALIFLCHGYAVECSITMKGTGTRLANAGFAVYGIDYEGHGKSFGLSGYIPCFDDLVKDSSDYFTTICEREENLKKARFLLGESMGGAVALLLHRMKPNYWDGAVLVAPMCKIADEMKPHPLVLNILKMLSNIIPTWKIVPSQDIVNLAIKEPKRREEVRSNPYFYNDRTRLRTGGQLLDVTLDIEQNLHEVKLPFIIVHGGEDTVTDPSASELLYKHASSSDKTFKLYPGMWHTLTSGEPPENITLVFADIIRWLDERTTTTNSRLERELKEDCDTADIEFKTSRGKKVIVNL